MKPNPIKTAVQCSALFSILVLGLIGCGVKGDPLPPEGPPSIGRGQPTFKRATQRMSLPASQLNYDEDQEEEESSQDAAEE